MDTLGRLEQYAELLKIRRKAAGRNAAYTGLLAAGTVALALAVWLDASATGSDSSFRFVVLYLVIQNLAIFLRQWWLIDQNEALLALVRELLR